MRGYLQRLRLTCASGNEIPLRLGYLRAFTLIESNSVSDSIRTFRIIFNSYSFEATSSGNFASGKKETRIKPVFIATIIMQLLILGL